MKLWTIRRKSPQPTRSAREATICPSRMTAQSVTPSPKSTRNLAYLQPISIPEPTAAANGSGTTMTEEAPASRMQVRMELRSSAVTSVGAQASTRCRFILARRCFCSMGRKSSVAARPSTITPRLRARTFSEAEGRWQIPSRLPATRVVAVPRSMARSEDPNTLMIVRVESCRHFLRETNAGWLGAYFLR